MAARIEGELIGIHQEIGEGFGVDLIFRHAVSSFQNPNRMLN